MPLDPVPGEDRARQLLLQALKEAQIENHAGNAPVAPLNGTNVYWQDVFGAIELRFYSLCLGAGRMSVTISVLELANRVTEFFPDDESIISALVDLLDYLKNTVTHILPMAQVGVIKRAENMFIRSGKISGRPIDKGAVSALFDMMTPAYHDSRDASEKRLRADWDRRGGSQPKLPENQRRSLHEQYDALHKLCRDIKKDYNDELKKFAKSRLAKGYSHKQWREHWTAVATSKYPTFLTDLIALFPDEDNPSASEIAYRALAKETGHKRSYLPRLIAKSRRAAKA